jgi:hypothetical protein
VYPQSQQQVRIARRGSAREIEPDNGSNLARAANQRADQRAD